MKYFIFSLTIVLSWSCTANTESDNTEQIKQETSESDHDRILNEKFEISLSRAEEKLNNRQYNEAIPDLEHCIELKPSVDFLYNWKGCATMLGSEYINDENNAKKAAIEFLNAIEKNPLSHYYHNLGYAYQMMDEDENAKDNYLKARNLEPEKILYQNDYLRMKFVLDENKSAMELCDSIIQQFPENCGYAYYVRGHLKRDYLKKYVEGNKDIKKSEEMGWEKGLKLLF